MLAMTPAWAIWSNGNTPKLGGIGVGVISTKTCNILAFVVLVAAIDCLHWLH